jgi:hypothetical protein
VQRRVIALDELLAIGGGEPERDRAVGVEKLNMWPLRDVYGRVLPFRSTPGFVATRRS